MHVFIDESGIHKKIDHTSFALVYVEISDLKAIEEKVCQIEKALKIEKFHWAETVWKFKEEFIREALKLDFKVKVAIIKNPVDPANELERVLSHMIIERNIAGIFIDGKKPKWYELKIKKVLRDKGVSVRKVRMINDKQSACIRLADMVAGLSRTYFDGKRGQKMEAYYKMLEKKMIILMQ